MEQPLAAPLASTTMTKPPTALANALESPGRHLDPTIMFTVA